MIKVPSQISSLFESVLEQHAIALAERASYRKWLRYYLDFCHKYRFNPAEEKSWPHRKIKNFLKTLPFEEGV